MKGMFPRFPIIFDIPAASYPDTNDSPRQSFLIDNHTTVKRKITKRYSSRLCELMNDSFCLSVGQKNPFLLIKVPQL